jgi:hypothetical protein
MKIRIQFRHLAPNGAVFPMAWQEFPDADTAERFLALFREEFQNFTYFVVDGDRLLPGEMVRNRCVVEILRQGV